jgi:alkanesulfonate monooxygenase SsuD/methylene tetrahydromethanopterin reductase-like flavin-dependent oxidoreductase (luciferase family)
MRFGIFFELSVPRPFAPGVERAVYENALEQVRVADEVGFDTVWAVEHHFLEEYSHCSAPELFLTACAMQTKQIRVGHGAVVCVPKMNHPVRIAERAAVLDILSGGRLELGTARSSTWTELAGFEIDPDTTKQTWDETIRALPRMWTEERFAWQGTSFSVPERAILPKPVQKPHPPLWVTVTSPGTELDAAERGIGCLGVAAASFKEQERRTAEYRRRIGSCTPIGAVNSQVATLNFLYCHEDPAEAASTGLGMLGLFGQSNAQLLFTREAYPTRAYGSLANLAPAPARREGSPADPSGIPEGMAIGDPDRIVRAIKEWESIGVDGVNFLLNAMEVIPQEKVLASLRLFAREVMPVFRKKGRA